MYTNKAFPKKKKNIFLLFGKFSLTKMFFWFSETKFKFQTWHAFYVLCLRSRRGYLYYVRTYGETKNQPQKKVFYYITFSLNLSDFHFAAILNEITYGFFFSTFKWEKVYCFFSVHWKITSDYINLYFHIFLWHFSTPFHCIN